MGRQIKFGVGIIGCGLIGQKRANALGIYGKLVACSDITKSRAKKNGKKTNAKVFSNWKNLLKLPEVKIVVICTCNNFLTKIALESIKHGKHVLIEKPVAKKASEIKLLINSLKKNKKVKVRVGFNLRYHPAIIKAKNIMEKY